MIGENRPPDWKGGKVCVGYLSPGMVATAFHESVLTMLRYDLEHGRRIGGWLSRFASPNLSTPRNDLVRDFLAGDCEWLLMIDTDMTFAPDLVDALLASANPIVAPVVSGLCFRRTAKDGIVPTIYLAQVDEPGGTPRLVRPTLWPPGVMVQVAATGTGCLLTHRGVFEAVQAHAFSSVYPWFMEGEFAGEPASEDVVFCLRAGVAGVPIFVNTGVTLGHRKSTVLDQDAYVDQMTLAAIPAPRARSRNGGDSRC